MTWQSLLNQPGQLLLYRSYDDAFENLEAALVDMTEDLLPGYATCIHGTNALELKLIMSELVAEALAKPLKDKALTQILVSLAVVLTPWLKNAHNPLEWAQVKQNSQL